MARPIYQKTNLSKKMSARKRVLYFLILSVLRMNCLNARRVMLLVRTVNAATAEQVHVDPSNINLIYALRIMFVLYVWTKSYIRQVNAITVVRMNSYLVDLIQRKHSVSGFYPNTTMGPKSFVIILKDMTVILFCSIYTRMLYYQRSSLQDPNFYPFTFRNVK